MRVAQDDHKVFVNCPTEILIEILSYLPVKSLLRFRSVCKEWNKLVQKPLFVNAHLKNRISNSLLIINCSNTDQKSCFSLVNAETFNETLRSELPMKANTGYKLSVIGSHNGLVCISSASLLDVDPIHIWNPSVRKSRLLPRGLIPKRDHCWPLNYLAFGFNQAANDHIVLRIVRIEQWRCCYQVEIYSLKSDCWRRVPSVPPIPTALDCRLLPKSICFSGHVYWLVKHKNGGIPNSVLCFDMATEEFHRLMLPDCFVYTDTPSPLLCLGVIKESLSVFHCRPDGGKQLCDIWAMKMGSWVRSNTVFLPLHGQITRSLSLFDHKFLLVRQIEGLENYSLALFDPEQDRIEDIGIELGSHWVYADSYTESLLLL
ncbi:F-box/kelch-repeat protein At3g23880-like [Cucurbita moschata]|uniref:F-box/kelch-repeat protein At3g23880-like n=1 Tax=Cucurbita moschata TaxID=3662 RepID=A0A6J1E5F4_CUCMO|nr:F-box/kelch-repeat protein At3g23880-like [Cucurbita moschata]